MKTNSGRGYSVDKLEENCPLIISSLRKYGVPVLNIFLLLYSNCCISGVTSRGGEEGQKAFFKRYQPGKKKNSYCLMSRGTKCVRSALRMPFRMWPTVFQGVWMKVTFCPNMLTSIKEFIHKLWLLMLNPISPYYSDWGLNFLYVSDECFVVIRVAEQSSGSGWSMAQSLLLVLWSVPTSPPPVSRTVLLLGQSKLHW